MHLVKDGWVEVITGSMFAGKSEELIRRLKRMSFAQKNILVFKPKIDDRYHKSDVVSHAGNSFNAKAVSSAKEILEAYYKKPETEVIGIDEIQFFDQDIVDVVDYLADEGVIVYCAGLEKDFREEAFGPMAELLVKAEFVTKLTAVCMKCGAAATRTQRIINGKPANYNDPIIMVGANEFYEPRCRQCHEVTNKPNIN